MKRFIECEDRNHATLLRERLYGCIAEDVHVRIIDAVVDGLEPGSTGFDGATPSATVRLTQDFKFIADFCREHDAGSRSACCRLTASYRNIKLSSLVKVAADCIKFRAVNTSGHDITSASSTSVSRRSKRASSETPRAVAPYAIA
jgi:hypothetical protein